MSEDLHAIVAQLERQKRKLEMQVRFNKNLALFKQRQPRLYQRLHEHQAQSCVLQIDPTGNINIADLEARHYLYSIDPKVHARQQVDAFIADAKLHRFRMAHSSEQNPRHLYIRAINGLLDAYAGDKAERERSTPNLLSNLIVTGVGLGYHLPHLVTHFYIQNLFIYEESLDVFHASMHCIDWSEIFEHCSHNNKSLNFCIGTSAIKALEKIEATVQNLGLHSQIFSFVYAHTARAGERQFVETYLREMRAFLGGLGYFDDERIGFAHAYHNLHRGTWLFKSDKSHARTTRALIIGNGPSLDHHEHYLREVEPHCLLISCGTALTSLLRMGIKPDFHVEMERPTFIKDVVNFGSTREQRQGIILLGLHTVSPETIACFDQACLAIKPNHAGTALVKRCTKEARVPELPFSNPTVTNCALSFVAAMGFQEVHLVGVDLGSTDTQKHHSRHSIYYDLEAAERDRNVEVVQQMRDTQPRPGNFGGVVEVTTVLDIARSSMERLLAYLVEHFPNFRCYNSNHGVFIQHTVRAPLAEIPKPQKSDKSREIADIKKAHFYAPASTSVAALRSDDLLKHFFGLREKIKLPKQCPSERDLLRAAAQVFLEIALKRDELSHYLLRGTLNCMLAAIVEHCLYCKKAEDFQRRVQMGIQAYNDLVDAIFERMRENPTEIDDTSNSTLEHINGSEAKAVEATN